MKRAPCIRSLAALIFAAGCGGSASQGPAAQGTTPAGTTTVEVQQARAKQSPPASGERRDVRFPAIARATTASGLELNTVEINTLPIVRIRLVVRSGSSSDPQGQPGVASLTASMMKEGTLKKSSAKLAEAVDFLGASLSVGSDEDTIAVDFQALSEHFDTAMDLVSEVALQPKFAQDELDKLKKRELARLSLQNQDPHFLAAREFRKALYGAHPYAHIDTTEAVVKKIKPTDLKAWHKRAFVPGNAFLVVTGNVSADRVKAGAERVFGKWTGKVTPHAAPPAPIAATTRQVYIVDRPESVQSMIYFGNLALARSDAGFIPLTVANQVLGGSASSRLFMDLREKRSLTYGAYSDVDELVQVAPFSAYAAVRTEVTAEAVAAFTEHLDRIVKEKPAQAELADAKRFLTDRFPLRIETAGKIAGLVSELREFGLPDDYWDRFRGTIEGVSAEAALAAAQQFIKPGQGTLVVVGKAAAFKPALEAYGPVTVVDTDGNVLVPAGAPAATAAGGAAGNPGAPAQPVPSKPSAPPAATP
jgi:zinc protease